MSYYLRKRALHGDMSRYICCGVRGCAGACLRARLRGGSLVARSAALCCRSAALC
jgi:hypothetical protein